MPVGATEAGSVGGGGRAEREEQQKEKQRGRGRKRKKRRKGRRRSSRRKWRSKRRVGQKRAAPPGALSFRGVPVLWLHAWSCCQWLLYPMGAKGDSGAVTMQSQNRPQGHTRCCKVQGQAWVGPS